MRRRSSCRTQAFPQGDRRPRDGGSDRIVEILRLSAREDSGTHGEPCRSLSV